MPVLGAMLGPFALAARLFGVEQAIAATATEPETIEALLDVVTGFLCRYALAFRETGAWGVIVAEAAAGRLSPEGLKRFSTPFVKRIVKAVEEEDFAVVVHNCHAGIGHLDELTASGAGIYHLGAPMDIVAALGRVGPEIILGGNLDPVTVFQKGTPQAAGEATRALLEATRGLQELLHLVGVRPAAGDAAGDAQRLLPRRRRIQSPIATASRYHAACGSHCSDQRQSSSLPVCGVAQAEVDAVRVPFGVAARYPVADAARARSCTRRNRRTCRRCCSGRGRGACTRRRG